MLTDYCPRCQVAVDVMGHCCCFPPPRGVEPLPPVSKIKAGNHYLGRDEKNQIYVFDGVRGTIITEEKLEALLKDVLDNRWKIIERK